MWRVARASATGTSHMQSDTPCQDRQAIGTVLSPDGATSLIAVIADGAGSATHSAEGAELVCHTLLELATASLERNSDLDELDDTIVRTWFAQVREALRARCARDDLPMFDFSATAVLAIAGAQQTLCAQIGDGAIALRTSVDHSFQIAIWPQNGQYANETTFVTDPYAAELVALYRTERVDDVILFSDGLERVALDLAAKAPFPKFVEPLARFVRGEATLEEQLDAQLRAFIESAPINKRTDDDKSLIVACRLP
ncbi:MAG TPA: PP2C family serine/threonine-protein phosphatase [Candidatus Binatia bacterium]|nr:PP2C family serine/threonine-protein phosphatase [Candidatus Binatia bacterium]